MENEFCKRAEEFVKDYFYECYEKRDFPVVISGLSKDISWFGLSENDVCDGFAQASAFIDRESAHWNFSFKIEGISCTSVALGGKSALVHGDIILKDDDLSDVLMDGCLRFTAVCVTEDEKLKLLHLHSSLPCSYTDKFGKNKEDSYTCMLENKLSERTERLKSKTEELEALSNNIHGGIEYCKAEDGFEIIYVNDGFLNLLGYNSQDRDMFTGKNHLDFVYIHDIKILTENVFFQLERRNDYSVQYRMVKKDKSVIWVRDKGTLTDVGGKVYFRCHLQDISELKLAQENERFAEKKFQTALEVSGVTMFEYKVDTGEIMFFPDISGIYNVSRTMPNTVESLVESGVIEPESVNVYKEMYRRIREGASTAGCYVKNRDKFGRVHDFELQLTNMYNHLGEPVRAIGVRKNVTRVLNMKNEPDAVSNLAVDRVLVYEVNISDKKIKFISGAMCEEYGIESKSLDNELIERMRDTVAPEHRAMVDDALSVKYIHEILDRGESLISFQYKRKIPNGSYNWFEATANILRDNDSGKIFVKYYLRDINEDKLRQQKAKEEKLLYSAMIAKAMLAYEVNISTDTAVSGHESWREDYGVQVTKIYSEMIEEFSKVGVHPEDAENFKLTFKREYLLKIFALGKRQIFCEYRRKGGDGAYRWVRCVIHMFEDPEKFEIKGFSYVEDIDKQKCTEIELRYNAEYDGLTGILNKVKTEALIKDYLKSSKGKSGNHAMMVIDIDYFKYVNDTFGHLFGDGVIKEVAGKIKAAFRDSDIVGRVGGDEFCVFLKNVSGVEIIKRKAEEICKSIAHTYTKGQKSCTVSASVGIAFYPVGSSNFRELFAAADEALYRAKKRGRNGYQM